MSDEPVAVEQNEEADTEQVDTSQYNAAEHLERIKVANVVVRKAADVMADKHDEYKAAKANHEHAVSKLTQEIDDDQQQLAFTDESPDAWRSEEIAVLGLPAGLVAKLVEADIDTLGALATYRSTKALEDIAGIGQGAVQKADDAMAAYWTEHPNATYVE